MFERSEASQAENEEAPLALTLLSAATSTGARSGDQEAS